MEWQRWVLEQIRDGLLTPGKAIQIAVASGHGIGKTALVCWITLWAMTTAGDTRGIITASTEAMLNTRLRAELRKWFRLFRAANFFDLTMTALLPKDTSHEQTWRVDLLPWNPNRPESFAGLHNAGRRILVIFDEASAIDRAIWETVMPVATDRDAEVVWCVFGNPLHPEGEFKNCFDNVHWITRHVDSRSVPITNKAEFQKWIDAYGEDSDFVNSRVKGLFPRHAFNRFISADLVNAAMQRPLETNHDPLVLGIDVARFGDDMSVIFPRKDGGVIDHLRRRGLMVHDVQFAAKSDQTQEKYANKRAEIWGIMRGKLNYMSLPNDSELKEQLCGPEFCLDRQDRILLEAKADMKRRGVASPDIADALAVTFAIEHLTMPVSSGGGRPDYQAVSEYNPFDEDSLRDRPRSPPRYYAPGWARLREDD